MRLDRMLSNAHVGTRSQVKKLVKDKRVKVNGMIAKTSSMQIDEVNDEVTVDEQFVQYEEHMYLMLNKPAGYISATEGRVPTVMDLIYEDNNGLFPCGRLDKDTEGLLVIMNDGPLAHILLSPKHHVEKEYYVEHALEMSEDDIKRLESGISYNGETYKPAKVEVLTPTSCNLTITEGKYHEIKFMFQALGDKVTYLKRIRMKNLVLDEKLKPGEYRYLTEEEIEDLTTNAQ